MKPSNPFQLQPKSLRRTTSRTLIRLGAIGLAAGAFATVVGCHNATAQQGFAIGIATNPNALTLTQLHCEYLTNPLTIDTQKPRLSWIPSVGTRGWKQSAYQIQVATTPQLLSSGKPDLWDSGQVKSDQTINVRYAGKALAAGQRCYWRVQVWDKDGKASPYSQPQFWQMGLLTPADWKGQWIIAQTPRSLNIPGADANTNDLVPSPYVRKTFNLTKPVRRATLYATARGLYEPHLNGAVVGDEMFAPGWTDYRVRMQYQAYDVTSQLRQGANALGAILGDGWYAGHVAFNQQHHHFGDTPALMMQLEVEYNDGTHETIGSDGSWQGSTGPIVFSDMLMGETYDARLEQPNWDTANFKATNWKPTIAVPASLPPRGIADATKQLQAAVKDNSLSIKVTNGIVGDPIYNTPKKMSVDYTLGGVAHNQVIAENENLQIPGPGEAAGPLVITKATYGDLNATQKTYTPVLVGTAGPPIKVSQELKPIKISQPTPGTYIYDMGQNMVGLVQLKVKGVPGTHVQLRYGEMLNPNGTLYTANLRAARATDDYICRSNNEETYQPRFTFHGFRYVEITGFPGTPTNDTIVGRVIGSDTPKAGSFSTSSDLVNKLQSNIEWGQRGNFLSVPTDCPQRDERLGWMGDAQIFVHTATYNRDVSSFFTKWMQDVEDAQSPAGGFSDVSPRVADLADGAPAWGDAGIIVPWTIFQAYDDTDIIDKHWGAMEKWMDYITSANPNGLWLQRRNNDFGDWLSINANTPKDVLATGYYGYDASLMARMARATGRTEDAQKYDALFNKIKDAFNQAYVNAADGTIKGNTQTSYLVGLKFNLLPEELRAKAAQHLVDDIHAKNDHLSTGFIGVGYLCPTLTDTGHNDVAYKLLLNDTFPSWGFSIRQGATTIWERWDGWTPDKGFQDVGMNSFNHYSLGSVGEWMYGHIGGITTDPAKPGFEHIIIHPHPGAELSFANTSYDSIRGPIVSNWRREGGNYTFDITIPANTTATVYIPTDDAGKVKEGTQAATASPGISLTKTEAGSAIFEVGSGSYHFTVPAA